MTSPTLFTPLVLSLSQFSLNWRHRRSTFDCRDLKSYCIRVVCGYVSPSPPNQRVITTQYLVIYIIQRLRYVGFPATAWFVSLSGRALCDGCPNRSKEELIRRACRNGNFLPFYLIIAHCDVHRKPLLLPLVIRVIRTPPSNYSQFPRFGTLWRSPPRTR